MLETHGKKLRFKYYLVGDVLFIENEKGRIHKYPVDEIISVLEWLYDKFGSNWFPLANNVQKLGNGSEKLGLGVSILNQSPGNITHAQGSSYLGVVLNHIGIFRWNERRKGIKWQILISNISKNELLLLLNPQTINKIEQ